MDRTAWLVCVPLIGHVLPIIEIAKAIVRNGVVKHAIVWSSVKISEIVEIDDRDGVEIRGIEMDHGEDCWNAVSKEQDFGKSTAVVWNWFIDIWKVMFDGIRKASADQTKPNFVISDFFTYAGFDIAEWLNVPLIVNNPCLLPTISPHVLPSFDYVPLMLGNWRKGKITWAQSNLLFPLLRKLSILYIESVFGKKFNAIRKQAGVREVKMLQFPPPNVPILVNSYWGLEYPRPINPLIHMIGPLVLSDSKNKINPKLEKFLSASKENNVIYISMGTLAEMQAEKTRVFKEFLSSFVKLNNVRFIWKTKELEEEVTENVLVIKWIPSQADLLKDDRVICFISHCGINSSQESLYFGKPILCVPMFGDQMDMALRIEDAGAGLILNKQNLLNPDIISSKLEKIIKDSSFAKNAKRISIYLKSSGGVNEASRLISLYSNLETFGCSDLQVDILNASKDSQISVSSLIILILVIICIILASS
jgi:UDP:flavonoid glycosyltransferase YjiC (YdhE family)